MEQWITDSRNPARCAGRARNERHAFPPWVLPLIVVEASARKSAGCRSNPSYRGRIHRPVVWKIIMNFSKHTSRPSQQITRCPRCYPHSRKPFSIGRNVPAAWNNGGKMPQKAEDLSSIETPYDVRHQGIKLISCHTPRAIIKRWMWAPAHLPPRSLIRSATERTGYRPRAPSALPPPVLPLSRCADHEARSAHRLQA